MTGHDGMERRGFLARAIAGFAALGILPGAAAAARGPTPGPVPRAGGTCPGSTGSPESTSRCSI